MAEGISLWWSGLETLSKVYWVIAIPFTVVFILQNILTFIGSEIDGDTDLDADAEVGFQFFTIKNFIAFFTIFGWTGIACINAQLSVPSTAIISLIAGLVMMTIMASIFYFFSRLTDSGTMDINNAIGGVGEVYMTIKGKRGNIGKVSIMVQGSLRELDAITDDEIDLKSGTVISVNNVINGNLLLVSKS